MNLPVITGIYISKCRRNAALSADDVLAWLDGRVVRWWYPDRVEFIDEVPKTSVGKFSKKALRDRFADVEVD